MQTLVLSDHVNWARLGLVSTWMGFVCLGIYFNVFVHSYSRLRFRLSAYFIAIQFFKNVIAYSKGKKKRHVTSVVHAHFAPGLRFGSIFDLLGSLISIGTRGRAGAFQLAYCCGGGSGGSGRNAGAPTPLGLCWCWRWAPTRLWLSG